MPIQLNRRNSLKVLGAGALMAGCQSVSKNNESKQTFSSSDSSNKSKALEISAVGKNFDLKNRGFTPQFFDGKHSSKKLVEIGFSLHCGATREWFKTNGQKLVADMKSGKKAVFFSHIIRHSNELPVGVELMKVGQERYPAAVYATLGLSMHLNRPVSAEEVKIFLQESGLQFTNGFSKENAEIGLLGVQRAYKEGLGISVTPFIKETRIG